MAEIATCEETTVLWPDDEHIDARCAKPQGHPGRHLDDLDLFCWGDSYDPAMHDDDCSYCKEAAKVEVFTVTGLDRKPGHRGKSSWVLTGHDATGAERTAHIHEVGYQSAKGWFLATIEGHVLAGDSREYPIVIEGGMARVGNYGIHASDLVFQ